MYVTVTWIPETITVQSSLPQNNIAGDFYSISHNVIFVLVVIMVIFMKTWKALVALHTSAKGSPYTHTHTHTQKTPLLSHMFKISAWPQSHWTGIKERERLWVKVEVSISAALLISSSCSCLRLRSCNLSTSVGVCLLSGCTCVPSDPHSSNCLNPNSAPTCTKNKGRKEEGEKRQKGQSM